MQGSGNAGFGDMPQPEVQKPGPSDGFIPEMAAAVQETESSDDFLREWAMPEVTASQTEPVGNFVPEPEVPGWDMAESIFAESSSQADSIALFSEDTAPTKIYEPKHHKKERGSAFPEPEQAAETAGNDWMIYG